MKFVYPDSDLVWLGLDKDEHVAAFITAGVAPIPLEVLFVPKDVEQTEAELLKLPKVSGAKLHTKVPNPSSFIELSERGLFVFDWQDIHRVHIEEVGAYEKVCEPIKPIFGAPLIAINTIPIVVFKTVCFAEISSLDARIFFRCLEGHPQ
jgi:hypothetical protein